MIRSAVAADLETILDLQEQASQELYERIFGATHAAPNEAIRERWRAAFDSGDQIFTVFDDGEIVGVSIVAPPWMHALHVRPDRWGTGVSRALHDHALDLIRRAGEHEALLRVSNDNHRAVRLWEKLGWTKLDWTERAQDPPHAEVLLYMKILD